MHWNSDAWVELQVKRLRKFIALDLQIFAFMDGVSPELSPKYHDWEREPPAEAPPVQVGSAARKADAHFRESEREAPRLVVMEY